MNDEEKKSELNDENQPINHPTHHAPRTTHDPADMDQLLKEKEEYLQGWKRAKADYENLVKEMNQKRAEYADWAKEEVLSELLPALDQYDMAMNFIPSMDGLSEKDQKAFKNWIIGLEAVRSLWNDAAKRLGLERVSTEGEFNPTVHEAVGEEENDSIPAGHIIRATMAGYRLNGKVIRCAKVIVSK